MKNEHDIEQLFQEGLKNYQPDVNPALWDKIQSKVQPGNNPQSTPNDGGSTSVIKTLVQSTKFWVVCSVVTVAAITTVVVLQQNDDVQKSKELAQEKTSISEDVSTSETDNETASTINEENTVTSEQNSEETILKEESNGLNADPTDDAVAENQEVHNAEGTDENAEGSNTPTPVETDKNTVQQPKETEKTPEKKKEKEVEQSPDIQKNRTIVTTESAWNTGEKYTFSLNDEKNIVEIDWYLNGSFVGKDGSIEVTFEQEGHQKLEADVVFEDRSTKVFQKVVDVSPVSFLGTFGPMEQQKGLGTLPNVFSPNGDGKNDYFEMASSNIKEFNIIIFNAQGQMVYGSEKPDFRWDGNDRYGKPLGDNEFRYSIRAVGKDGRQYQTEGSITINR